MITFEERLIEHGEATNRYLLACLDGLDGPGDVPERLIGAMHLAVMGGGKRFRPFLVMSSAGIFGVPPAKAVATGAALELMHCYSLVHDDLPAMDNDRLRRGQPTVWAAFDEWTAILAGDALLTLSFETLARDETHPDPKVRGELITALARAGGAAGMVGGQALDLAADKLGHPAQPTLVHIRRLQAMKTGALIQFACEAGAILGGASDRERRALASFGAHLGVVFQIADDLLDVTGDSVTVGKATGKDAAAGKATQVSLLGVEASKQYLDTMVSAALGELSPFGPKGAPLAAAVRFAAERVN
jgi:farnesyl diphosphate synthase